VAGLRGIDRKVPEPFDQTKASSGRANTKELGVFKDAGRNADSNLEKQRTKLIRNGLGMNGEWDDAQFAHLRGNMQRWKAS